uniref:Uncharacterized protein n=1 Tax=Trichobilharzia regenti TaxID=157069 RepID=A0AA85K6V8_TRIRE|nr:unnamed protein product [Trichobilharzia regenti]
MSAVLQSQPYAIYPTIFNPYKPPCYKRFATFSYSSKKDDINSADGHDNCKDEHSPEEKRPESHSAKYSSTSSSSYSKESSTQQHSAFNRRQIFSANMKLSERRPQFKAIRKQLQGKNEIGDNNWLLTSKINLIPRPITSVNKKTVIPSPNMDMFVVKAFGSESQNIVSKAPIHSRTPQKNLSSRRPQSAAASNHLISFRQNTSENSTNISAASSRVNTPIPHLSGKPVTMLKQHLGRPSSAPCFLAHPVTDSSRDAKTEFDTSEQKPVAHSNADDQHSSSTVIEQASCDSQTIEERESNEKSDDSKVVLDRKLLKECRIILEDEYDRALRQHGWRMEIPGDPLNLKYVKLLYIYTQLVYNCYILLTSISIFNLSEPIKLG